MATRKPFTPGEILAEKFLKPYNLSQAGLADAIGVTRRRINEIVRNKRVITPDTALRLGKYFNMTPAYWLNLQMKVDLWNAEHDKHTRAALKTIKAVEHHAAD